MYSNPLALSNQMNPVQGQYLQKDADRSKVHRFVQAMHKYLSSGNSDICDVVNSLGPKLEFYIQQDVTKKTQHEYGCTDDL